MSKPFDCRKIVAAALVAIAALGVGVMPAWAASPNTENSPFHFYMINNSSTYYHTDQRPKNDYSKCYVKATYMDSYNGVFFAACSWTTGMAVFANNTVGGRAYMPYSYRYLDCNISNTVRENGWQGCGLWMRTNGVAGDLAGVWSPDSSGVWYVLYPNP